MTDLVNPLQAVMAELHPDVETDPGIQTRLMFGKTIHLIAAAWFHGLDGFAISEARVDGAGFGLAGIRGRIDFRVGRSIVEFKTTTDREMSVGTVMKDRPQDLEQLLVYAVFSERTSDPHWLVYYHAGRDPPFTAFRVEITSPAVTIDVLSRRLGAMNRALDTKDLRDLPRCRYMSSGCDMYLQGLCPCAALPAPDSSHLARSLQVEDAPDFARSLEGARRSAVGSGKVGVGVWDLFVPRQAYLKNAGLSLGAFRGEDEKYGLRRYVERSIDDSNLAGNDVRLMSGDTYLGRSRSLKVTETDKEGRPSEVEMPYVVRAIDWTPKDDWLPPAYAAQLAVHCALRGAPEGLLVLGLVNHPGQLVCYRLRFKDLAGVGRLVRERLEAISMAVSSSEPGSLATCPEYTKEGCGNSCLCRRTGESAASPALDR